MVVGRGQENIPGIPEKIWWRAGIDLGNNNGKGTLSLGVDYLGQHYFLFKYSVLIQKNKLGNSEDLNWYYIVLLCSGSRNTSSAYVCSALRMKNNSGRCQVFHIAERALKMFWQYSLPSLWNLITPSKSTK